MQLEVEQKLNRRNRGLHWCHKRRSLQTGAGLIELVISIGVFMILIALVFQSFATLTQVSVRESMQSDAISKARGAMEYLVNSFRDDLVLFNTASGTSLGVNFSLDDASGNPVVRDGLLYYVDRIVPHYRAVQTPLVASVSAMPWGASTVDLQDHCPMSFAEA